MSKHACNIIMLFLNDHNHLKPNKTVCKNLIYAGTIKTANAGDEARMKKEEEWSGIGLTILGIEQYIKSSRLSSSILTIANIKNIVTNKPST